jgi:hypothetical protein
MITLGIILLVLFLIFHTLHFLLWAGVVLLAVGVVLLLLGTAGRAVGGRKHWY